MMFDLALLEILLIGAGVALTVFWFWALIDCAIREHEKEIDKLVWVLVIVSTYVLGAAAYLVVWRSRTRPVPKTRELASS